MRQGLGIGVIPMDVSARYPELEMVLPQIPAFEVPVWLVAPRELYTSRKIRLVFDVIAKHVRQISSG